MNMKQPGKNIRDLHGYVSLRRFSNLKKLVKDEEVSLLADFHNIF
jgi:thioredoxin-related protein